LGCTAVLLTAKLTAISLLVLAVGLSWETAYRVVVPVVATNTTGVFAVGLFIWLLMRLRAWRPFDAPRKQWTKDLNAFEAMRPDREDSSLEKGENS